METKVESREKEKDWRLLVSGSEASDCSWSGPGLLISEPSLIAGSQAEVWSVLFVVVRELEAGPGGLTSYHVVMSRVVTTITLLPLHTCALSLVNTQPHRQQSTRQHFNLIR